MAQKTGGNLMNEKIYKTLSHSGALNLTLGIVALVTGVSVGVLLLVNGARLLGEKAKVMI
jgi:hypothetical protein